MTRVLLAVIDVDLADLAESTEGTGTREIVDEIVACSSVLARVGETVVHVQFAVLALESFSTLALVRSY